MAELRSATLFPGINTEDYFTDSTIFVIFSGQNAEKPTVSINQYE